MNKNKIGRIINEINKHYGAKLAFIQDDRIKVSGETGYTEYFKTPEGTTQKLEGCLAIDYYGEYRGGYPWIDKWLETFAKKENCYWEWDNPAVITLAQ